MLWLAGVFAFVTPEPLYSMLERKANKKYGLSQETKFINIDLLYKKKKVEHFSVLRCLYNIK